MRAIKGECRVVNDAQTIKCMHFHRILERTDKIIQDIECQRKEIQRNLKKQFQWYVKKCNKSLYEGERTIHDPQKLDFCFTGLSRYVQSCQNLMGTYFPILAAPEFVSLQTESALRSRIGQLKNTMFKPMKSLSNRLLTQYDSQQNTLQQSPSQRASGSQKPANKKTPIENSFSLTQWLLINFNNPYPSPEQKQKLAEKSNLSRQQVNNWFINARERVIKKYLKKETREREPKAKGPDEERSE